jgi:hypothetical protein
MKLTQYQYLLSVNALMVKKCKACIQNLSCSLSFVGIKCDFLLTSVKLLSYYKIFVVYPLKRPFLSKFCMVCKLQESLWGPCLRRHFLTFSCTNIVNTYIIYFFLANSYRILDPAVKQTNCDAGSTDCKQGK